MKDFDEIYRVGDTIIVGKSKIDEFARSYANAHGKWPSVERWSHINSAGVVVWECF